MIVNSKEFYKNKQAFDIYRMDHQNIVVSDPVLVNNGWDRKYLIG